MTHPPHRGPAVTSHTGDTVMGLRHKSIRLRVLLLILVPVLSLVGVYAYAATITVNAAVNLQKAKTVKNVTAEPAGAV